MFLTDIIINNTKFSSLRHVWPLQISAVLLRHFGLLAPNDFLKYLDFQSFDYSRSWWRFFPKHVVHTTFDISVFITCSTICQICSNLFCSQYCQFSIDIHLVSKLSMLHCRSDYSVLSGIHSYLYISSCKMSIVIYTLCVVRCS